MIGLVAPVHTAHHPHNTEQYDNTTNSSPPPPHWPHVHARGGMLYYKPTASIAMNTGCRDIAALNGYNAPLSAAFLSLSLSLTHTHRHTRRTVALLTAAIIVRYVVLNCQSRLPEREITADYTA